MQINMHTLLFYINIFIPRQIGSKPCTFTRKQWKDCVPRCTSIFIKEAGKFSNAPQFFLCKTVLSEVVICNSDKNVLKIVLKHKI